MSSSAEPTLELGPSSFPSLSASTWELLRGQVEAETGMDLSGTRFARLEDALRRVAAKEMTDAELRRLLNQADERTRFLERLTGQLTIGESFFFRNEHHFRALREHVVPEILKTNAERREIRMWAAGCAGGEEPYSLAILLDMILGPQSTWRVSILGTDLNPEFLARAREASYREWSFRQTDVHRNDAYFASERDSFRVQPRLRNGVRFSYLNLVKDVYPSPLTGTMGLDLIVFRNVAIYLRPEVTRAIIERFHAALRPGGWLLLGETEVTALSIEGFEVRHFGQATLHRKVVDGPQPALPMSTAPFPILDTTEPASTVVVPGVPTLPNWVPLPRRGSLAQPEQANGTTASLVGDGAMGESSAWMAVAQCLTKRDFSGAQRTIDRMPDKRARGALRLRCVRVLMSAAEIDLARSLLETCLSEDPMLIEAQLLKASFAEDSGELNAAEFACRRALYLDRNCEIAHFHLALIQQQIGDASGAERSLRTTLRLTEWKDPHQAVEFGDGICHARLREMALLLLSKS